MPKDIFDSDSEQEDEHLLTINEHFAKAFEYRKEREELAKLKEKYGSDAEEGDESEDSEDLESEDEDGEELTPAVDAAILRTLAKIKKKDPSIYMKDKAVFEEEHKKTGDIKLTKRAEKDKSKPLTMRQHALQSALNPTSRSPSPQPLTHIQEQRALKEETIKAFHTAVADDEDDEDDVLVLREKTKDELEQEEEEYKEYLQREVGEDLKDLITVDVDEEHVVKVEADEGEGKKEKKKKKERKGKEKEKTGKDNEEADQEFLMNYILNRGWIDKSERRLPTYKEITSSKGKGRATASDDEDELEKEDEDENGLDDEEEFEEIVDRFESSYNFRFEEPDAANIPRYPRNIQSLVRREDTTRKEARERRKARKEEELLKKKEEVKRLKSLKMKDLREKLEQVGKEGGMTLEESQALQELDLEADWDPEKHDRQMADIYANVDIVDDEKPTWDDDIDIADIAPPSDDDAEPSSSKPKKKKKKKKTKDNEDGWDEGGVDIDEMDADVQLEKKRKRDEEGEDIEWDGSEEMRKKVLEEYMDEVYGLEFNDMVGDMPTRFKYAKVAPQAYNLTPTEILLATDAELNEFMGLRKFAPYRKESKNWDNRRIEKLKELKAKLKDRASSSWWGGDSADKFSGRGGEEPPKKKRKGKKERMKEKGVAGENGATRDGNDEDGADVEMEDAPSRQEKESLKVKETNGDQGEDEPSKKKRKRKHKKSSQNAS
ncbi:KRI1-like family C-terminal-domain-containing protein [Abortiporus biennis]|nr:KRI1-like family C-terminal-domain-containing protein [Abortiporus biennis]